MTMQQYMLVVEAREAVINAKKAVREAEDYIDRSVNLLPLVMF